jgi:uracil-DNA glycosylase
MPSNEEFSRLVSDTEKFLKQQQGLYGDLLFLTKTLEQNDITDPVPAATMETPFFDDIAKPEQPSQSSGESLLPQYPNEAWTKTKTLSDLNNAINTCTKCSLGRTRKKFVFGVGNPQADVVVVGEAPGADEDEQGEPFVGRAGQLLTKILEAIKFPREEVFICNILKCRPPNNRDPQPEEIDCCEPYLWKQLEIIKPKMILCAGRIAGQSLLKTNASLGQLRGKVHDYRGIPLMVTYHPAALLRNPNWKRPCWEDVQEFRRLYDAMRKEGT